MTALLKVEGLRKQFATNTAVNGISFTIEEGSCFALLGPNGAGKTTTLRMLCGLMPPTEGTISFTGLPGAEAGAVDLRQYIGFLPQFPAFYGWMTGHEYLAYVAKLSHVPATELKARTAELLEMVGLKEAKNRKIGGYSGGMKQRLGLAQALVHRPKLLMLDEPVSALDPIGRREVLDLMRAIRKETTILFSTHVLHDAEEICDNVLIMCRGEIAISGRMDEVRRANRLPLIEVEADDSLEGWVSRLQGKAGIVAAEARGREARIQVSDIDAAKRELLADLACSGVAVNRFTVGQTSLEDLFMKVVQTP